MRELHALAKKSRTEEQRLQDLETEALLKAALGRRRDREHREEQSRRGEFAGEANDQLDQDLEKLFAKSGFANMYHGQEPKPWNGRDPIWNVSIPVRFHQNIFIAQSSNRLRLCS